MTKEIRLDRSVHMNAASPDPIEISWLDDLMAPLGGGHGKSFPTVFCSRGLENKLKKIAQEIRKSRKAA
jgi:hypothetical protein